MPPAIAVVGADRVQRFILHDVRACRNTPTTMP
jgi:hypothetical protein